MKILRPLKVTKYFKYFVIFNGRKILTDEINDRRIFLRKGKLEMYSKSTIKTEEGPQKPAKVFPVTLTTVHHLLSISIFDCEHVIEWLNTSIEQQSQPFRFVLWKRCSGDICKIFDI